MLFALLRPDPRQIAMALEPAAPPAAVTGLATIVVANFVMVAVMAMAPVHMDHQGHGLRLVGLVISLHIAGMFAPAPLTGWLTDRLGPLPVAAGGAAALVVAGALAATDQGALLFAVGLTLLGTGWNACLIAGSAMLASAVTAAQRPRAEGLGELSMGVAAASATAVAAPVVGLAGYATLAVAGAVAAGALAPFLIAFARRGVPAEAVPAARMLS